MARPGPGRGARARTSEGLLLLVAWVVSVFALVLAGLQLDGAAPAELPLFAGTLGGGALLLHLLLRRTAPRADPVLLPVAVALNGIGLAVIGGLDGGWDGEARRQLVWTALGAAGCAAVLLLVREPRRLQRYPYLQAVAGLVLLLLPVLPVVGVELYGARRWVAVGGYTVQPSEFAKVVLIVFLAAYLALKGEALAVAGRQLRVRGVKVFSLPRMRDLGPMTIAWGFAILVLVGTKDLGTSLLLFGVFLAMLYAATRRKSWVGIGLLMFSAGAAAAWAIFWHVQRRVDIWLNAFDPEVYRAEAGGSHQLVQGLFALADGGLTGTGFAGARSAGIFAADSDLVLVSIGEVYGLTGLAAVLLLLLLLVERGFRAALDARERFVALLACGLAFLFAFQVFVVLGGVTRLIPLTGMTTPFLSAGGSSLIAGWVVVGLWLRISDTAHRPPPRPSGSEPTELIPLRAEPPPAHRS
ncbi:FtsW/RodA/SpoVE family cell cycle protein [Nocardiopsis composta]|uniref:peptidoglycan glycosyltransferase n=1 Tax=Nocardiopsis composta TaxID=157465 RepID=A0A7W8QQS6_9ACTN|nr:FtsW/RodA/SpoVE family cell cycle protein [Nocardiopsis composta]MBB5434489.1 cell division protein FtsW (lipid II flippase) [Nocardiopsis composta]